MRVWSLDRQILKTGICYLYWLYKRWCCQVWIIIRGGIAVTDIKHPGPYEGSVDVDVFDPELDLSEWDESQGNRVAKNEGIHMTPEHWAVVNFLRKYFSEQGRAKSGRVLAGALEKQYHNKGGRKYLYSLFPQGPVAQACRIGGLPVPEFTRDKSFGSSM